MAYDPAVKSLARNLFMEGKSAPAILREVQVAATTLKEWRREGRWDEERAEAERVAASEKVEAENREKETAERNHRNLWSALEANCYRHIDRAMRDARETLPDGQVVQGAFPLDDSEQIARIVLMAAKGRGIYRDGARVGLTFGDAQAGGHVVIEYEPIAEAFEGERLPGEEIDMANVIDVEVEPPAPLATPETAASAGVPALLSTDGGPPHPRLGARAEARLAERRKAKRKR